MLDERKDEGRDGSPCPLCGSWYPPDDADIQATCPHFVCEFGHMFGGGGGDEMPLFVNTEMDISILSELAFALRNVVEHEAREERLANCRDQVSTPLWDALAEGVSDYDPDEYFEMTGIVHDYLGNIVPTGNTFVGQADYDDSVPMMSDSHAVYWARDAKACIEDIETKIRQDVKTLKSILETA